MREKIHKFRWYILGLLLVGLLTVPVWGSDYVVLLCLLFCLYLALSQMWNLLAGYSGLISLGQQAFIGIGGYTVAVMASYYGMHVWVGSLMGGFFSILLALFMSLFIFRMKGLYFAIGTWVFAEALTIWFGNWKYVNSGMGMFVNPTNPPSITMTYYASLIIGVGAFIFVYVILRSKLGLGLMAMRDNEAVSETMGVEVFRSKLYCFLIGAFVTGTTAGVLYVFQVFIYPYKAFAIDWTVTLVFIVVIGGIGTIEGPVVGTLIFVFLSQWLAEYSSVSLIILGTIAIVVILVAPRGIMGTLHEKIGFEILSPRRE
jgi:branched-chain amino acid transport system permease protein